MRPIVLAVLLLASTARAEEQPILGWTADGALLVYKTADDTGEPQEFGSGGQAELAVVVDVATGKLTQYLLALGAASAQENKLYRALPNKAAFAAWLEAHPVACATGRKSPDGKARANIKLEGRNFTGKWSGGIYTIEPAEDAETESEVFRAVFSVTRDGKIWDEDAFSGRMAFSGSAQGCAVLLCWARDGKRVAWNIHTPKTMRDPEMNELGVSIEGRPAFDPDGPRTAARQTLMTARRANVAGMHAYRVKNYVLATKKFREAIAADAGFVTAHYNLACVAALQGDKKSAVAELKWLAASSDPEAEAKLKKARTDPDLGSLVGDPEAKALFEGGHDRR